MYIQQYICMHRGFNKKVEEFYVIMQNDGVVMLVTKQRLYSVVQSLALGYITLPVIELTAAKFEQVLVSYSKLRNIQIAPELKAQL